jgi:hypothetical protein
MIRIRPYGAGFGQFDSAYKVGEGILFRAKIPFNFTHFTGQKPSLACNTAFQQGELEKNAAQGDTVKMCPSASSG